MGLKNPEKKFKKRLWNRHSPILAIEPQTRQLIYKNCSIHSIHNFLKNIHYTMRGSELQEQIENETYRVVRLRHPIDAKHF